MGSVGRVARVAGTVRLAVGAYREARVPFAPSAAIERAQGRRVRRMVAHAYGTVPFYRRVMEERGLRPGDFRTAADLARLPLIDAAAVNRHPGDFLSCAQPVERYHRLWSGGTTGRPRAVYHDVAALLANAAHGQRNRPIEARLVGRRFGYRETALVPQLSSGSEVRRAVGARSLIPARVRGERQELSLLDPLPEIARRIEEFKPHVLRGYGSALALLFAHYRASGAAFHRPKVVRFVSDALPAWGRRLIEEEFGVPVLGSYGAIEAFKIGFECERGRGYHLNVDLYPVRLLDEAGGEAPPGTSGEVVVSNLVNRATVLLNYRLGDLGTLATESCPCGRTLPLLASLDGRRDDVFVLPSGRVLHPMALLALVDDEVVQYQVVQESPGCFRVALVAAPGADRTRLRERVAAGLAENVGEPAMIDIALVDAVERTPGGKVRPFVSRVGSWSERPTGS